MPKLPYMKLRSKVWYTAGAHAALELRPDGRNKAQVVCTGIKDLVEATKFSVAYGQFIRERWTIDRYAEARAIHPEAADIYYRPYKTKTEEEAAAEENYDLCFASRANELAQLARERDHNAAAALRVVEVEAELEVLKKELGKAVAGADIEFKKVADEYYDWGCLMGGRNDAPWAHTHQRKRKQQLKWWGERMQKLSDITLQNVERHRKSLMGTHAGKTLNQYTETIRHLCSWAKKRKYLLTDPLEHLGRVQAKPVREPRAITAAEAELLLKHCLPKRVLLYEVALNSGLRRNELWSLVVSDVDTEHCGLQLHKEWTKSRKDGFQPIPDWLVTKLAESAKGKKATDRLLPVPSDPALRFREDCKRAGIPDDKLLVFHSLRKGQATGHDQSGGSVKTVQLLTRHSTPALTYKTYVGAVDSDMRAAVEKLGEKFKAQPR